ncbi:hypothetical protein R1917_00485 [Citrobacter koseri]|uniref:hypothetical protein n=1 Tax=Citrobacter koseri TaxID=545 RepID=UPI0029433C5A|nr:hypothetical protein [Citrobacter koseri]WOJ30913.1 hypothetical protein R1917_00485 [Citrobacter koseri]WOJ35087.1 hypothetical protein R1243_21545 [Citrobacter koseri]
MNTKDQRIELRLPQQLLEELDNFINSIDGQYKPSRSDVLRSFIAQGISRKYTPAGQEAEMFPLAARLNLFFQICQQQQMQFAMTNKRPPVLGQHRRAGSNITAEALVRQVYLQRMFWFFELDKSSLAAMEWDLTSDEVLSLMQPGSSQEVCEEVVLVANTLGMFRQIKDVLSQAEQDSDDNNEVQEKLSVLKHYLSRRCIPSRFRGYPENWHRHNQIAALIQWIKEGKAGNYGCDGYGGRISVSANDDADAGRQYGIMLQVYQDIAGEHRRLELDGLISMAEDRRLDFSAQV